MTTPQEQPLSPPSALEDARAADSAPTAVAEVGVWHHVSPKYATVEIVGLLITAAVTGVIALIVALASSTLWPWLALAVIWIILLINVFLLPRRVRSIRYLLREDDLLFRRGIMWQRQVAVPYGRMQLIDITRGPIARMVGLSELKFVTAAAGTNLDIPGLPIEQAEALRDSLVAVAETRRTGL